ncbi:MAG: type II secretion system protein J [Candidatus Methylacidiphilales bacterium]
MKLITALTLSAYLRIRSCLGHRGRRAFTLMEVLVAMAVLTVLVLLIAQITNAVFDAIRLSNRAVDAAAQSRLAFDRIGLDINAMVKRADADFVAKPTSGPSNEYVLQLLASSPSSDTTTGFKNRGISLVGYRILPHANNDGRACLIRGAKAISWDTSGWMGLDNDGYPVQFSSSSYPLKLVDSDFDVLAPGVVRMVVGYQLYPDNEEVDLADGTHLANARGQIVYSAPVYGASAPDNQHMDLSRVSALIIGLAVIDLTSLKLLDATKVNTLASAFSAMPPVNAMPVEKWMADTSNLTALPNTIPAPVRSSVRLYQRVYPITPFGTRAVN